MNFLKEEIQPISTLNFHSKIKNTLPLSLMTSEKKSTLLTLLFDLTKFKGWLHKLTQTEANQPLKLFRNHKTLTGIDQSSKIFKISLKKIPL
jgi:hypothetical protein